MMRNKRILVVDDDHDVRLGYQIRLRANHYDTFFAADSVTAITAARKHEPDLIILDLGLPGGDGFVVMERLRVNAHLSMVPIIVVSARDAYANRDRSLEAGATAYLQKPVDNDVLLACIRQCLGEGDQAQQAVAQGTKA